MCSESLPKDFEKTTEVLPFTKYGLSSIDEFQQAEEDVHHQEWLRKAGLSGEEIKLYQDNEAGLLDQQKKIESGILRDKLEDIHNKISSLSNGAKIIQDDEPSTSSAPDNLLAKLQKRPLTFYPEGHPMNELKEIEQSLFGHLKTEMIPITKRRKILRRLERKKERLLALDKEVNIGAVPTSKVDRPGSLWDVKEPPQPRSRPTTSNDQSDLKQIGPKPLTLYTIKDNKIMRLEPAPAPMQEEYRAVDIVLPVNAAEAQLLEGTKMTVDEIKKIDRFKDYEPGVPSKVLYLKNIAPSVTEEQISLLFNQFVLANGGPIDVRLLSGRMRGQAFVALQHVELATQALEEINGTILSGRPIIAQFGRNTNRIQPDDLR